MDFWSKMLSSIADTVLPKDLDDDVLLLQMDEALQEEKGCGTRRRTSLIHAWSRTFKITGTQHIAQQRRKQAACFFPSVYPDGKFAIWHHSLLKFMSAFLPNYKHLMSGWQIKKLQMQQS